MESRRIAFFIRRFGLALMVAAVLLCACCGCTGEDNVVRCTQRLRSDAHYPSVSLSDGRLEFHTNDALSGTTAVCPRNCKTEESNMTYEKFIEYTQLDPLSLEGISRRMTPKIENIGDYCGIQIAEDYHVGKDYDLKTGDNFGGVCFWGKELMEGSAIGRPLRYYNVVINRRNAYNYIATEKGTLSHQANSIVGEIPVYVAYYRNTLAVHRWDEWDESTNKTVYYACFEVGDYNCGMHTDGYTQQEFVELLLAIINHYGAYPSQTAETATAS